MSRKRKRQVADIIDRAFQNKRINENIRSIKLDESRYNKQKDRVDINEYRDEIYERFNMKQYNNEAEFRLVKLAQLPKETTTDEQLRTLWRDYQYRDKLVISGQYEEYRYSQYRKNYIKALKEGGFPRELINNIEKISLDKWKDIIILPSYDKTKLKDTQFPKLGGFKYGEVSERFIKSTIEEIRSAFDALGLVYTDESDLVKKRKEIIKAKSLSIDDDIETAINIDNVLNILPKYERGVVTSKVYTQGIVDEVVSLGQNLQRTTKRGTPLVKTAKDGHRYIPFVGTTKQGSPNEKFMKVLLAGYDSVE